MQTLIFLLFSCALLHAVSSFGIAHYSVSLRRTRKLFNSNAFNTLEDRIKGLPLESRELNNVSLGPLSQIDEVMRNIEKLQKKIDELVAKSPAPLHTGM